MKGILMGSQRTGRPHLLILLFGHWPFFVGCVFAAVGLIAAFCFSVLGLDLFQRIAAQEPGAVEYANARLSTKVLPISFVVIGVVLAIHGFLKCRHLARHGIIIAGTVRTFHSIRAHGLTDVSYTYCVDGKGYEGRVSVGRLEAEAFRKTPQIFLLVDPDRPDSHVRLMGYKVKDQQPEDGG
jgi:hypothetical protein